jgi:uncharacterized protein YndB with AHSA1/START domain
MNHYQRQLLLSASPDTVYRALSTQDGLRSWWTETCDIVEAVDGLASFRFGQKSKIMRVERLDPQREVRWVCVGGVTRHDEWIGTKIVFRLSADGDRTRLDFEHIGLVPALECFEVCERGWNHFMDSLKNLVETGQGHPFVPADALASA